MSAKFGCFAPPQPDRIIVHPIVSEAAEGRLPSWAVAGVPRRAHMGRVAELLDAWGRELDLGSDQRVRWRAAGFLHDVLRDEDPESLRPRVPPDLVSMPEPLLHGPAAAERLRVAGVEDGELLLAIAFHTVGDPRMSRLGRALYVADFLEPGRSFLPEWRAGLRARAPAELDDVLLEVVRARIGNLLERGTPILPRTTAFWNALVEERS